MQIYCEGEGKNKQTNYTPLIIYFSPRNRHLYLVSSVDLSSVESHSVGW